MGNAAASSDGDDRRIELELALYDTNAVTRSIRDGLDHDFTVRFEERREFFMCCGIGINHASIRDADLLRGNNVPSADFVECEAACRRAGSSERMAKRLQLCLNRPVLTRAAVKGEKEHGPSARVVTKRLRNSRPLVLGRRAEVVLEGSFETEKLVSADFEDGPIERPVPKCCFRQMRGYILRRRHRHAMFISIAPEENDNAMLVHG